MAQLQDVLGELRRVSDISAVAIARRDGIPIAHSLPKAVSPKKIAAMGAAIVGTSEMAAQEIDQGELSEVIVGNALGKILAAGAGEEAILITLVRSDGKMGLVLWTVQKACRTIAELLRGSRMPGI